MNINNLVRPSIQQLKPYIAGKSTEEVRAKYGLDTIIKLGSNENPLGTSVTAQKAMADAAGGVSIYPDGSCSQLVGALSSRYQLPGDWFITGNGSDEIFLMIAAAFLNPGEISLVSEHTFSQYACVSGIFNGVIKKIPLADYTYDLDGFRKQLNEQVKLIFLCNPNNPTGTYLTHKQIAAFLDELPESCLVVMDEAYGEFAEADDFPDMVSLVKTYQQLIVCRTFSKIYGLAAVRLGYAIAQENIIKQLKKVKNFNPFNVNSTAQAGAVAALEDKTFFQLSYETNMIGKKTLTESFKRMGITSLPTQGNFICFQTPIPCIDFAEQMAMRGVIIRPLNSFGMDDWCRVTIGTPDQNKVLLKTMEVVLSL
ncbi:MAG: histidinol-phosphate transaminase [Fibrobacteria bacterium]|nr:histidinol-phosphate transaminase [Fibrobacteria bacterium]